MVLVEHIQAMVEGHDATKEPHTRVLKDEGQDREHI